VPDRRPVGPWDGGRSAGSRHPVTQDAGEAPGGVDAKTSPYAKFFHAMRAKNLRLTKSFLNHGDAEVGMVLMFSLWRRAGRLSGSAAQRLSGSAVDGVSVALALFAAFVTCNLWLEVAPA
jgi:hypothetical protein